MHELAQLEQLGSGFCHFAMTDASQIKGLAARDPDLRV
jgi:hypothetical protein